MADEKRYVEIAGGDSGVAGSYLDKVFNKATGEYYIPVPGNIDFQESIASNQSRSYTGSGTSMVVLDTGILSHHPYMKSRLFERADFTGTGPEDENGHGTVVALLAAWVAPDTSFHSGKILDATGFGSEEAIVRGIEWAISLKPKIINISAGINNKKWGLFKCKGSCDVCKAAERAASEGIMVLAAAGNTADITLCPASLGLHGGSIMAVAACEMDMLQPADYSGDGNISAPAGTYVLQKIKN